jgi:ABC-type antimicrobial peptide transport system permease subunit
MKDVPDISPPRWARKLLAWYCKPELLEDLEGDLNEYFRRNAATRGARRARLIYVLDVLKFFRFYTVRKPELVNALIHWIMIGSYIKTSGRSIVRNKLFSVINIVGLAISMSVALLVIGMLSDVFSYDKFHGKHDTIYRVIDRYEFNGKKDSDYMATTSPRAAKAIKENFTGVEEVAILCRNFSGDITVGEKTVPLHGLWADEGLFKVFSFHLLQGDPSTALKTPFSVVLTEKSARKLFGDENALGKTLILHQRESDAGDKADERQYTITGIMKDLPVFSHMKFEMLGSWSTREITQAGNNREMAWDNVWSTWVYVVLPDKTHVDALLENLKRLAVKEDKTVQYTHVEFDLQPLDDIMIGQNLSNQIGETLGASVVWILSALAFIVVLSACLNYTNLSIARSFRRTREVGIRKTIGALKSHVVSQFMVESVIISLLALVFGFGLFLLIRPHFLSMENSLHELLTLELSPRLAILFVLFALFVGACAGFFPALFFSRINAVQVLKNISAIPALKGVTMRKVLIVFQYCISIIAITTTLILYKQYKHFIHYDLGFNTANILNIRLQGNDADVVKAELSELPEVEDMSQSLMVTSVGNYWGDYIKNPDTPADSTFVGHNSIDENYLPLHEHQLVAGRNFKSAPGKKEETEVIVNEEVLKKLHIADANPAKAIGQVLKVRGKDLTIIGVVKDFFYGRANDGGAKAAVILRYGPDQAQYLNIKVLSTDWPATYAKIEDVWKKIDKVHQLDAKFYDAQIEEGFQGLKASMKVGSFLAILVICIACIGLLGMVVFTSETRRKEVSIRKVLGASEFRLLYLLSRGFLILLLIAAAIGIPLTYLAFDRLLLPELANHAPLGVREFLLGAFGVMVIALIMIGTQTLKVARTNPADVLKAE